MRMTVATPIDLTGLIQHTSVGSSQRASAHPPRLSPLTSPATAQLIPQRGGAALSALELSYFEQRFGYDFSKVRIHTDSKAAENAKAVQARAYTIGSDIIFGSGEYAPATAAGKRLLAHELAHVLQQAGGTEVTHGAPAAHGAEAMSASRMDTIRLHSLPNSPGIQRVSLPDVIDFLEWTNPLTFSTKAFYKLTGVELNLFQAAELTLRKSATKITMPNAYIAELARYARANPADGEILTSALAQSPSYYQGGWLLSVNGEASAITFGNSIFFRQAPPRVDTFIHEMVHINQYRKVGRVAFVETYFGMTFLTVLWRVVHGQPVDWMKDNPYEGDAYAMENRFNAWVSKHP